MIETDPNDTPCSGTTVFGHLGGTISGSISRGRADVGKPRVKKRTHEVYDGVSHTLVLYAVFIIHTHVFLLIIVVFAAKKY